MKCNIMEDANIINSFNALILMVLGDLHGMVHPWRGSSEGGSRSINHVPPLYKTGPVLSFTVLRMIYMYLYFPSAVINPSWDCTD